MTQILSGHGCFNSYLHRIRRVESAKCAHCEAREDTAKHTLEACPSWTVEREELVGYIGNDLSLENILRNIVMSAEK
jgi:hypothetical protein